MTVKTYSHLAVGVHDMDRALAFYRDVVGLEVVCDEVETFGADAGEFDAVHRRGVYLRWESDPRSPFLVLDELIGVDRASPTKRLFQDAGVHHFGFWVDDVDEMVERSRAAGAPVFLEPRDSDTHGYGEAPGGTIRTAIVADPDGNAVQFDQRVSEPPVQT